MNWKTIILENLRKNSDNISKWIELLENALAKDLTHTDIAELTWLSKMTIANLSRQTGKMTYNVANAFIKANHDWKFNK